MQRQFQCSLVLPLSFDLNGCYIWGIPRIDIVGDILFAVATNPGGPLLLPLKNGVPLHPDRIILTDLTPISIIAIPLAKRALTYYIHSSIIQEKMLQFKLRRRFLNMHFRVSLLEGATRTSFEVGLAVFCIYSSRDVRVARYTVDIGGMVGLEDLVLAEGWAWGPYCYSRFAVWFISQNRLLAWLVDRCLDSNLGCLLGRIWVLFHRRLELHAHIFQRLHRMIVGCDFIKVYEDTHFVAGLLLGLTFIAEEQPRSGILRQGLH